MTAVLADEQCLMCRDCEHWFLTMYCYAAINGFLDEDQARTFFVTSLTVALGMLLCKTGHLIGCGGADLHNLRTSASSASLGHFSAQN